MFRVSCIDSISPMLHTFSHAASSGKGCGSMLIGTCSVKVESAVGRGENRGGNELEYASWYLAFG